MSIIKKFRLKKINLGRHIEIDITKKNHNCDVILRLLGEWGCEEAFNVSKAELELLFNKLVPYFEEVPDEKIQDDDNDTAWWPREPEILTEKQTKKINEK